MTDVLMADVFVNELLYKMKCSIDLWPEAPLQTWFNSNHSMDN